MIFILRCKGENSKTKKSRKDVKSQSFYTILSFRRKEKSLRETRQRLDSRCGVTCEDFSLRRNDKLERIIFLLKSGTLALSEI
jgi:hypothetical protein